MECFIIKTFQRSQLIFIGLLSWHVLNVNVCVLKMRQVNSVSGRQERKSLLLENCRLFTTSINYSHTIGTVSINSIKVDVGSSTLFIFTLVLSLQICIGVQLLSKIACSFFGFRVQQATGVTQ